MKLFILKFLLKNHGFPPIHAHYLVNQDEKKFLEHYLSKDFFFQIREEDYVLNCSNDTLEFEFEDDEKEIKAFQKLYQTNFYSYDILSIVKERIDENTFNSPKKSQDEMFEMEEDINFYMSSKKSTPEFSNLDDEKIKKFILETRKTVNLFKSPKD